LCDGLSRHREALRAAQGDVRCGVCSTTFNALENLSEQAFKAAPADERASPDDSMTVEELPGGENIELSAPVELADRAGGFITRRRRRTKNPTTKRARMEFHGSAADLDRLFVVDDAAFQSFEPVEAAARPDDAEPAQDLDSTDEHPILVLDERDELPEVSATDEADEDVDEEGESIVLETLEPIAAPLPERPAPPTPAAANLTAPRILIPDEMRRRLAEEADARATAAREFELVEASDGFLSQRWPWVAAVALLALLFVLQVLHSERNDSCGIRPWARDRGRLRIPWTIRARADGPVGLRAAPVGRSERPARGQPPDAARQHHQSRDLRAALPAPAPHLAGPVRQHARRARHRPADYLPGAGARRCWTRRARRRLIRIVDPGPRRSASNSTSACPPQAASAAQSHSRLRSQ
jgi:hypothetical protein